MKNYYKISPTPTNARMLMRLDSSNLFVKLDEKIIELAKQDMVEDFSSAEFNITSRSKDIIQEMIDNNMRFYLQVSSSEELARKMLDFCASYLGVEILHLCLDHQYQSKYEMVYPYPVVNIEQMLDNQFINKHRKSIIFVSYRENIGQYLSKDVFCLYERMVFHGSGRLQLDNFKVPYSNVFTPNQDCGFNTVSTFIKRKIII